MRVVVTRTLYVAVCAVSAIAGGCAQLLRLDEVSVIDGVMSDVTADAPEATPEARVCFGPMLLTICLACVVAATTITVSAELRGVGNHSLDLIASNSIAIVGPNGKIDVETIGTMPTTAPDQILGSACLVFATGSVVGGAGGGAGGSFTGSGGAGGNGRDHGEHSAQAVVRRWLR
jgi:hypothetical protein